jgi:hypothetical protein
MLYFGQNLSQLTLLYVKMDNETFDISVCNQYHSDEKNLTFEQPCHLRPGLHLFVLTK